MNIDKWREGVIDPYSIKFKNITIIEILSYPHAGNDVYKCLGTYRGKEKTFYLKIERNDKTNVSNEIKKLNELKIDLPIPKVLDYGNINNLYYIVTDNIDGLRLSQIDNFDKNCLIEYGKTLAVIHSLDYKTDKIKERKINDIPIDTKNLNINKYIKWLNDNKFEKNYDTFIHGDFHYANILWKNNSIIGILDWEYSGMGSKEQDIAWSIIKRETQKFMKTKKEVDLFLEGYKQLGTYDPPKIELVYC